VVLVGYVPFENIESVDWHGDEYYGFPHLYCYFDARRKEPYEKLAFCEKKEMNGIPFYTEVTPTMTCGSEVASLAWNTDDRRLQPRRLEVSPPRQRRRCPSHG
jgi:hypothetical protein